MRVGRTVLDNGIRVLTERVDYVRSVSLGVWVRTGSRDERPNQSGMSHFLEHMVFKGSERRSALEIAQALESVGGGLDAFTSREHTCFLARMLGEHLPLAVDVIGDLIQHPTLSAHHVEVEKQVVVEEIRSLDDVPDELVHEEFAKNVWHDHPLRNSVLGCPESVCAFTSEDIGAYRREHYACDRIVVTAAGYLEHDAVVDLVRTHLGALSAVGAPPEPVTEEAFSPVRMTERDLHQEHICIGCRGVSYGHTDRYAVLLLASLLGGGMSSRLYQSVREEAGLAYAVSTHADFMSDSGLLGTYVAVSPENARDAVGLILTEVRRLRDGGIAREELESVKAQVTGGLMIAMEGMTQRMSRLAKAELNGQSVTGLDAIVAGVRAVTADDVLRVLGERMRAGQMCVVGLGPVKADVFEGLDLSC